MLKGVPLWKITFEEQGEKKVIFILECNLYHSKKFRQKCHESTNLPYQCEGFLNNRKGMLFYLSRIL